jgi:IQ calmodulin-binding motif
MFSKPVRPPFIEKKYNLRNSLKNTPANYTLTHEQYFKNNVNLKKYKLPELKNIIKEYSLTRTGNKDVLIERIESLFNKMRTSIKIQKMFRGWLVRRSFKLRGPAFWNKKVCVNDTDFITLEPLSEIPYELFYSYKDNKDFVYGFNLTSLMQMIRNKSPMKNPYNREQFPENAIQDIISLNNITTIIYENSGNDTEYYNTNVFKKKPMLRNLSQQNLNPITPNVLFSREYYRPTIINGIYNITEMNNKYNYIIESRAKPVETRIRNLFMEIDQLGNYSQSTWFSSLDRIGYLRFYRCLYDLWNFRAQLSYEVKKKICPFIEPFANIFNRNVLYNDAPLEDFQMLCITVMENLIYCGFDDEFRKIAAFHLLSALTIVSPQARSAMPWLYESVAY